MNSIFRVKKQDGELYLMYSVNGQLYRAYEVGNLPAKFGCINWKEGDGISGWFTNHASGLTFVSNHYFPKGK